jgi:sugar phosphate isomerase/epimerase
MRSNNCNVWSFDMTNRREFIETLGAVSLTGAGLISAGCSKAPAGRRLDRIGVQLYSVRGAMEENLESTVARVAEIGYSEVEFAGYFDRSAQQIRSVLDQNGLTSPATHLSLEALENEWDSTVEFAQTVGHHYLVVPSLAEDDRTSLDGFRAAAERLNRVGQQAQDAGLAVAYHNHNFEFEPIDGHVPYDVLVTETDPALVVFEMDLFWITRGGGDPFAYFSEHPGRFHLVHVKDMNDEGEMVSVGAGSIDFAALFAQSEQAGIRHYFVEHDNPADPFASITASYNYLSTLEY